MVTDADFNDVLSTNDCSINIKQTKPTENVKQESSFLFRDHLDSQENTELEISGNAEYNSQKQYLDTALWDFGNVVNGKMSSISKQAIISLESVLEDKKRKL